MGRWLTGWLGLGVLLLVAMGALSGGSRAAPGSGIAGPLRSVATDQKVIALTFDWSWGTVMGPRVLAILQREHIPATFFLSGPWALSHPELVDAVRKGGFEIESHGQAHVNFSGLSREGVAKNIQAADAILREVARVHPHFIRPPNGDWDRRSLEVAQSLGYRIVLWGTDSLDWMNPGVEAIAHRVLARAHPGDIVLLHSSDTCKQTDLALPAIIRGLRAQGYRFVTLSELVNIGTPETR